MEVIATNYLEHHGILGQKWGVRRFQNEDGSLTKAGEKRYSDNAEPKNNSSKTAKSVVDDVDDYSYEDFVREEKIKRGRRLATAATVLTVAAVAVAAHLVAKKIANKSSAESVVSTVVDVDPTNYDIPPIVIDEITTAIIPVR